MIDWQATDISEPALTRNISIEEINQYISTGEIYATEKLYPRHATHWQ